MAEAPFPSGIDGAEKLPQTQTELQNCFDNGKGQILPRPSPVQLSEPSIENARGSFKWNGALYGIWGTELRKVTDLVTGATSLIGTIDAAPNVQTAIGFNEAVICVPDGKTYTLSKADVLLDITPNSFFQSARDVAHIDGRFIYIPSNGDPAFFSDVGNAGSIQPLSFFDAEELPDLNQAVLNFGNTLYILGEDSIELFRDTGGTPNPFTRIQGARQRFGFIGALLEYANSFLFIGREQGQDYGIYATGPGQTAKISNARIDEFLSSYTLEELQEAVPGRFKWRGHDIATFTLARDSFGFLKGKWFRLQTLIDGISRPWLGGFITEFETKYYTASKGKLGRFDAANADFGSPKTQIINFGFNHPENDHFSCQSLDLGIAQGFNASVGTVSLQLSRDNVLFGPALFRDLGALGEYNKKLTWNPMGGLGAYDGFMGIKIITSEDVVFATDKLYLNLRG